jgi:hypothetical protein
MGRFIYPGINPKLSDGSTSTGFHQENLMILIAVNLLFSLKSFNVFCPGKNQSSMFFWGGKKGFGSGVFYYV